VKGQGLAAREAQWFRWAFALTTANGNRRGHPSTCPMPYMSAASLPSETVTECDGRSGERVVWGEAERAQVALRVGPDRRWFRWAFALTTATGNRRGHPSTCPMPYMSTASLPSETVAKCDGRSGERVVWGEAERAQVALRVGPDRRWFRWAFALTTANGTPRGRPCTCSMPYMSAPSLPSETVAKCDGRSGRLVLEGGRQRRSRRGGRASSLGFSPSGQLPPPQTELLEAVLVPVACCICQLPPCQVRPWQNAMGGQAGWF
jgi:hypothetical protein